MTGEQASLAALAGTVLASLLVVRWMVRRAPAGAAELEARLPALTPEEQAAAAAVAARRAEEARARGETPDEGALLALAVREARIARFRAAQRVY